MINISAHRPPTPSNPKCESHPLLPERVSTLQDTLCVLEVAPARAQHLRMERGREAGRRQVCGVWAGQGSRWAESL